MLLAAGPAVMSVLPPWLMMFLVVLVSMPHYGATLLRVYERSEERRAYAWVATHSTALLLLLFAWGVHDVLVGSILFTLYLTWSPWHYTAQNYGITLMFLGRRGVPITPQTKLVLRVSYLTTFVITFFFIHGQYTATLFAGDRVQFLSLNIPALWADMIFFTALLAWGASALFVAVALARQGLGRTGPALALMGTQALWFVLPAAIKNWLPYFGVPVLTSGYDAYAFTWIALGHAAQYLWITAYFATASGRASSSRGFYVKALMSGCAIWTIPLLLFAPGALGRLPYDVGLASVTAAVVNLHHFVLDGAIWKLRDSRIRRVLVERDTERPAPGPGRLAWPLLTAGLVSLVLLFFGTLEEEFGLARNLSAKNVEKAGDSIERLATVGRDSPYARLQVGSLAVKSGDLERAVHHLEAGVALYATATGWARLGDALRSAGDERRAAEAFEKALAIAPDNEETKMRLALTWAELGERERAKELLDRARFEKSTIWSRRLYEQVRALVD